VAKLKADHEALLAPAKWPRLSSDAGRGLADIQRGGDVETARGEPPIFAMLFCMEIASMAVTSFEVDERRPCSRSCRRRSASRRITTVLRKALALANVASQYADADNTINHSARRSACGHCWKRQPAELLVRARLVESTDCWVRGCPFTAAAIRLQKSARYANLFEHPANHPATRHETSDHSSARLVVSMCRAGTALKQGPRCGRISGLAPAALVLVSGRLRWKPTSF
jgi:hypothetical protein